MGRPRGFDEAEVVRAAASLFANRAYDGISVDELVSHLGLHRNSLYKTFGSKRGLYLAALRWCLKQEVPLLIAEIDEAENAAAAIERLTTSQSGAGVDLLLLAAVERAPVDQEVALEVKRALNSLDEAVEHCQSGGEAPEIMRSPIGFTATLLGLRLRVRAAALTAEPGAPTLRHGPHPS
ncbi:MAG: TetR/AcrR family transcriptional regulator, transcriptional repressor for nem operon [Streptomyces sp.]|jgi:TetR/AcrR family transcriptional repressor of nem operon|nr:TetR/AcrR family transcriptional regulator, transcriptional repressor for nem operon [Streptomyces sp.]